MLARGMAVRGSHCSTMGPRGSHRNTVPPKSETQTEYIEESEASLPSGWLVQWPLSTENHCDEDHKINGTCSWNHPVDFSRPTDNWRHPADPSNGAYHVDHITCHLQHQQQRPHGTAQSEERSHVVEQKRSILVPANPYRCADMPEWLRMYARAPTKYDHILKWSLFQMTGTGYLPGHAQGALHEGARVGCTTLRGIPPGCTHGTPSACPDRWARKPPLLLMEASAVLSPQSCSSSPFEWPCWERKQPFHVSDQIAFLERDLLSPTVKIQG
uniref:Uncharacterized protein n=1 Tax=Eptatretus burgeri TaxID=7764 RepID=A0A8C4NBL9_EPTBU